MFGEPETYRRVRDSGAITRSVLNAIYRIPEEKIALYFVDNCLAVKVSFPRPEVQGDIRDCDSHGGQQYPPIMDIEIP
jgi:hypothetical protein